MYAVCPGAKKGYMRVLKLPAPAEEYKLKEMLKTFRYLKRYLRTSYPGDWEGRSWVEFLSQLKLNTPEQLAAWIKNLTYEEIDIIAKLASVWLYLSDLAILDRMVEDEKQLQVLKDTEAEIHGNKLTLLYEDGNIEFDINWSWLQY